MAILFNGLLGSSTKSVGNIVTYKMNGQQIARTKAAHYKDAKTTEQVTQRNAMTSIVALARLSLGAIRNSFPSRKKTRSGFNEFVSKNLKNGAVNPTTGAIVPANLIFSAGSLLKLNVDTVAFDNATKTLTITIVPNSNTTTGLATDKVKVVVYDIEADEVFTLTSTGTRADASHVFNVPMKSSFGNRNIHIYTYACEGDDKPVSDMSDEEYNEYAALFE